METWHIKGSGAIDPNPDRPGRPERTGAAERVPERVDSAAISLGGRETRALVEAMVRRLAGESPDRAEHVDAVRRQLENGDLDQPGVFVETARKMLMGGP